MFVSTDGGFNHQLVTDKETAGPHETFTIEHVGEGRVRIQASNGSYLSAASTGLVTSSCSGLPGDDETFALDVPTAGLIRSEYQLMRHLGSDAAKIMDEHRATFMTRDDFAFIASLGINTVRIPVGYWIVSDSREPPYVPGGSKYLDDAFVLASSYGLRVIVSLHAARGSQNGYDHSSPRDR